MAAAATAAAASLGVRAAVSPLLRRGRGRRRRARGGREEKREEAVTEPGGCCCRCACPPGPSGRPPCRSLLPARPASGGGEPPPPPPPPPPPDRGAALHFVFRAPITLSKPGELHEEYRSQLRKASDLVHCRLRDEKLQEERTPEDFIHKLIFEDTEAGRRKTEEPKKEEPSGVRMTQEHLPERLSDSENEEPFQGKCGPPHRSAFVSKGSSYSLALLAGLKPMVVVRTGGQCEQAEAKSHWFPALDYSSWTTYKSGEVQVQLYLRDLQDDFLPVPEVNPLTSMSTPVAGVLSSTQNNRCLSAPDLTAEKRVGLGATILPKLERSISPESNDSISEELNHFKPIVCSPCTPPKRLPDGQVLSPLIIKSTPRNLTRSLQKPTTYEASPRILRKWEQISQERQVKKTLSKATLTSSALDAGEDSPAPSANTPNVVKEHPQAPNDFLVPSSLAHHTHAESDGFLPLCGTKLESSRSVKRDSEAVGDGPAIPPSRAVEPLRHPKASNAPNLNSASRLASSGLGTGARKATRVHAACPENGTLGAPTRAAGKKQQRLKYLNGSDWSRPPNGACRGEEPPSLRRGRKRQCKTKHLEQGCAAKRPRRRGGPAGAEPLRRSQAEQRRQEEEDRRLALQLQWAFDRENRRAGRRRGRADQYFLRSQSTVGTL
ncbi:UNVERIFIED_CONTAM: hypothetical protein K2H54_072261 [Gekko kuhli]